MKIEFNLEPRTVTAIKYTAVALCCCLLGATMGYNYEKPEQAVLEERVRSLSYIEENQIKCSTTQDLNRQDIQTGIVLSRFCEGLGLQSAVFWQQDNEGNPYALPICIPKQEEEG